jgi:hypothetical protein
VPVPSRRIPFYRILPARVLIPVALLVLLLVTLLAAATAG